MIEWQDLMDFWIDNSLWTCLGMAIAAWVVPRRIKFRRLTGVVLFGFHLDNKILHARGLFERKGAPETFDAAGFVALMRKVRAGDHVTYPTFDRENDCTVPDEGEIAKETKFIVVEGNYLLLNSEPWSELTELFDVTVRLDVPRGELQKRLIARWIDHGLSLQKARERALGNDMVNVDYVLNNSRAADFVIRASA